jgi:hypothetical protein
MYKGWRIAFLLFGLLFVCIVVSKVWNWGAGQVKKKDAFNGMATVVSEIKDVEMDSWYSIVEKHQDPWGNPITLDSLSTQEHIVLTSMGEDGEEGTHDDVKYEWKKPKGWFNWFGR